MAKKKRCGCICCHQKSSTKPLKQVKDKKGVSWNVYKCRICGYTFCESKNGLGGRKELADLNKKEIPLRIGG